jgi:hypothetical protein
MESSRCHGIDSRCGVSGFQKIIYVLKPLTDLDRIKAAMKFQKIKTMKKTTLLLSALSFLTVLNSCENQSTATEKKAEITLQPNDSLFTVNEGGYNFQIVLPKDLMIANTPSISMNEATGELNIRCGEQFWIIASLEKTDIPAIKNMINEDMLFTSRVIEETNNSILFQRILPDGTEYDYNYRSISNIDGKPYIFKTSEEGEFSMESVGRMKLAISTVHQSV